MKEIIRQAIADGNMSLKAQVRAKGGIDALTAEQAEKLVKRFKLQPVEQDAYQQFLSAYREFDGLRTLRGSYGEAHGDVFGTIAIAISRSEDQVEADDAYLNSLNAEIRKAAEKAVSIWENGGRNTAREYGQVVLMEAVAMAETAEGALR